MECDNCGREMNVLQAVVPTEDKLITGGFYEDRRLEDHPDHEYWCGACIFKTGGDTTGGKLNEIKEKRQG